MTVVFEVPGYRVTVAGEAASVKLGDTVTVSERAIEELKLPDVPVTVRLNVPV